MADLNTLTPYILGLMAAAVGWLFKQIIQQGKDIVAIQTAFKYYVESTGKGAAMVLNSPNPTPPEIRALLQKHGQGRLSEAERTELVAYLKRLKDDVAAPKAERSAAIQLLAAMETMRMIKVFK